jgi:AGZA family xanthine/uracil permease-like MFS transporter
MTLFTYSIANGQTTGLVVYPIIKLVSGRYRELRWGAVSLGFLCLIYSLFGLPH